MNFSVFLTWGHELFVRCFHRYCRGEIIERQRYVFAKDGCVRYIFNEYTNKWRIATKFKEPRFASEYYPYAFDNSYCILNANAFRDSDMQYCELDIANCLFPMQYMRLYIRHPNIEYLVKSGYGFLILQDEYRKSYWEVGEYVSVDERVDLKSNNLLKMLQLNRTEFKLLQGREIAYPYYLKYREIFPKKKPDELIAMAHAYKSNTETAKKHAEITGLSLGRLTRYLSENDIDFRIYNDYLNQCIKLKYDLHDTAINMPHDFHVMHDRLSTLIKTKRSKTLNEQFKKHYDERSCFEFRSGSLFIRQPKSIKEIADEGAALCHCVGGYAERHAKGQVTILFLRQTDKPDEPYYTVEIDSSRGKILQCFGYKNNQAGNPKPAKVKRFEKQYEMYLQEVIYGKRD